MSSFIFSFFYFITHTKLSICYIPRHCVKDEEEEVEEVEVEEVEEEEEEGGWKQREAQGEEADWKTSPRLGN